MKLPQTSIERCIAVLLSASVVWLMVACVSLCSSHCIEQEEEASAPLSREEFDIAHEVDCCPITSTPVSLMPERQSLSLVTNADQAITAAAPQLFNLKSVHSSRVEVPYTSSGPPLSQLCVLRI